MSTYTETLTNIDNDKLNDVAGELVGQQHVPGDGDFILIGKHFASIIKDEIGINRKTRILDVGCSIGRLAVPLTQMVDEYDGFDVVPESIDTARDQIQSQYPNFRFKHVDVYNFAYRKNQNSTPATDFVFPYEDKTFDVVVLVSVFTHMLPTEIENYMSEIGRVLKPGGNSLITYFIDSPETQRGRDRSFTTTSDPQCITLDTLDKNYKNNDMRVDKIMYGWWSSYPEYTSYQDVVISKKIK